MTNPLKSHKKIVDKSIRQNVRQSVIIHLAPKRTRQKRRPPLSNSSKSLEVRHVHLYNTPSNPISKDNSEELRKIQMEMKLLREERTQINNDLHRDKILASSFTANNPLTVEQETNTEEIPQQLTPLTPLTPRRRAVVAGRYLVNRTPEQLTKLKVLYPNKSKFPTEYNAAQNLIDNAPRKK
jgi:hypothetical protein